MKTIEAIINEIKASEELQKKLEEAAKNNTIAEFLKELGCEATAEEFAAAAKAQSAELSEAELDAVAGGYNEVEMWVSICSLGIGCLIHAVESAVEDIHNGIEKTEGRLLCETSPVGG